MGHWRSAFLLAAVIPTYTLWIEKTGTDKGKCEREEGAEQEHCKQRGRGWRLG